MDVLSDVLGAVRLTGAIFFDIHAQAPWVAQTPPIASIASRVMPSFERVVAFHVMVSGHAFAELTDTPGPVLRLDPGDAVLVVGGDGHVIGSEPGQRTTPDLGMWHRPVDQTLPFAFRGLGGAGEPAHLVCGFFGCDQQPFNPIMDALPRFLHVRAAGGSVLTSELIRIVLQENEQRRVGGESILAKLSELLFLQAVRGHIDALPREASGWLAGLRDPQIGAALQRMHGRPAEGWTLETLAREIGLSRSVFAERFGQLMGVPAMHYLARWRLQLAARMLERRGTSIAEAAAAVGYESEAAFNRAFKKQLGVPPGTWRRARFGDGAPKPLPA